MKKIRGLMRASTIPYTPFRMPLLMRLLFHDLLCAVDIYLEDGRSNWHVHTILNVISVQCTIKMRIRAGLSENVLIRLLFLPT
jgi:hypothetical protein